MRRSGAGPRRSCAGRRRRSSNRRNCSSDGTDRRIKEKRDPDQKDKEKRAGKNLKKKAKKIREWLEENEERTGTRGKPINSNTTDNESAIATVDDKFQVAFDVQAFCYGHEAKNLEKVVDSIAESFSDVDGKGKTYREVVHTAHVGFHSEQSVRNLLDRGIDAYVLDPRFR